MDLKVTFSPTGYGQLRSLMDTLDGCATDGITLGEEEVPEAVAAVMPPRTKRTRKAAPNGKAAASTNATLRGTTRADGLLTSRQAAELIGLSPASVTLAATEGKIPKQKKDGNLNLYKKSDILKWRENVRGIRKGVGGPKAGSKRPDLAHAPFTLTVADAAARANVTEAQVTTAIQSNDLAGKVVKGQPMIHPTSLGAWMRNNAQG